MKIVLVRHGYSEGNKNGTFTGWSDVKLSQEGIEDLKRFKNEYAYPETERYYTSDLVRTIDTFDILFGDEKEIFEQSPELREIYFGKLEDVVSSTFPLNFVEAWSLNERHEDWETRSEFSYRIISKLELIAKDMKENDVDSATIVCHSGVIKTILISLGNLPYMDFKIIPTSNGLGYVLDLDYDEEKTMLTLNDYKTIKKIK